MDKIKPLYAVDEHVERLLDAALEQTFPASDPVAIDVPPRQRRLPLVPSERKIFQP